MVDSFGDALRQLRQDRGWSLGQLAREMAWSKSGVGMFETGERRASLEFAKVCDQVFGTAPFFTTLCGVDGEDMDMRRRALLGAFTVAAGVGATTSLGALSEVIRINMQEAADVPEDWDAVITDYQQRLVNEPSAVFGDQLLVSMLVARQLMSERRDPEAIRASAHLGLLYGIWMGYNGSLNTGRNYYQTAAALAERSDDVDTQVYVLARAASGGPYQGLSIATTQRIVDKALALAGDRASTGALEAHAAQVHLAALCGNLDGGRAAVNQMWELANRLPPTTDGPGPAQRTASFAAYLEGRLGGMADAEKTRRQADMVLAEVPQWHADAKLYYARAMVRHGDHEGGLGYALQTVQALQFPHRVLRLGVDDVMQALPLGYRSDLADALRPLGTTGPKPWEL